MKKKIFLTGADGFIGSHLAEALVRQGHSVTCLAYYNSVGYRGWLDYVSDDVRNELRVVDGDIRDYDFLKSTARESQVVMHLAALIGIPHSYVAPSSYLEVNITGTHNLLRVAREISVEHFIHTSTSEVYGTARYVPINESHPLSAQSPYAASKIAADQLALSYHKSYEVPLTILRPFNTYGPRQSERAVISTVINQALSGCGKVFVGNTHSTRDFTFVSDTVTAYLCALDKSPKIGKIYNLGTGYEISIGDLISLIGEISGNSFDIVEDKSRMRPVASEVDRLLSDNSMARSELDWEPRYLGPLGLKKGLEETCQWIRKTSERPLLRRRVDEYRQ